jgi:hypothetical protein
MPTDSVPELRACWPQWAAFLHHRSLESLAAWLLEAAGPLGALGAQAVYLGEPLLRPLFSNRQLASLVSLLENDGEAHAFAAYLREEGSL